MRTLIVVMLLMFYCDVGAATAYWTGLRLDNGDGNGNAVAYYFYGDVYGENGESSWVFTHIYGHLENGRLYLKHDDFSQEMMDPTFNWWTLALYGDIVSEATFAGSNPNLIELSYWPDIYDNGGTLVETPDDFYMAFKVSEVLSDSTGYVEGMTWYGWAHVSVDASLEMTLLDSGINLYGGAVTVGAGIPEPSGGVLMLLGLAALGLRRREFPVPSP